MNGDFIEAALHVQAMRLVCKALADREQQGIEVDWCVLRQMYDQMDAMLQALQHKHRYDSSDMVDLRKDRDAARAEIETLRKELDAAKRAASDEFTERQVLTVEQQQDAAAWQQELDAARAEIETLKGAMAADDQRLRAAEERIWPERTLGCDAPDAMADEILHLRQQLRTAAGRVDLTEETNRNLRQQLAAANAAWNLQCAGIERLQEVVTKCRRLVGHYISYADINSLRSALAELDAGTEPTPVAEPTPCPECERLQAEIERLRRFVGGVEGAFGAFQSISPDTCCDQIARCLSELEDSPAPVAEPAPCPKCERLQAELETANEHRTDLMLFVDKVRKSFRVWGGDESFFHSVSHALDQLDAGTIKPTPVAKPFDAEGGA